MGKNNNRKQKNQRLLLWLIIAAAVILVAVMLFLGRGNDRPSPNHGGSASGPHSVQESLGADPSDPAASMPSDTQPDTQTQPSNSPSERESQPQHTEESQPASVIVQRTEAEYEKWLSATMVVCISMEYPDFQLEGIYAASSTELEDKFSSDGAYIVFTSGGSRMAIHAQALEAERTAPGTVDISSETIGYATFDPVDPDTIDFSGMEQVAVEDLSDLIAQSLLVSIYTH